MSDTKPAERSARRMPSTSCPIASPYPSVASTWCTRGAVRSFMRRLPPAAGDDDGDGEAAWPESPDLRVRPPGPQPLAADPADAERTTRAAVPARASLRLTSP